MKVFIADDSPVVRSRLVRMLSEYPNVEVIGQAGDAPEAVEAIDRLQPDVLILDIRMPSGSGIDVLQAVKSHQPSLLVIMLTNYPYPQYRAKSLEAGADYFFDKASEFEKITDLFEGWTYNNPRPIRLATRNLSVEQPLAGGRVPKTPI